MSPTYSVIMTSFNYAAYIGAAIDSVLAQTFQDWELLIVDDRSTDASWEIIQRYRDPRIQRFLQPVNLGACEAYNFALAKARGRLIASLDSDDVFMPGKLERQMAFLERHPEVDICGVHVAEIDEAGMPLAGTQPHAEWFNTCLDLNDPAHWVWTNHLCHSGVVVRAEMHRTLGPFDTRLVSTPDWEFWLRGLVAGARFAVIPEPLVGYRNHGENITQNSGGARMSLEHARTASELLIPWLIREGRSDLLPTLVSGFVTHAAGRPVIEAAMAKDLARSPGAGPMIAAALHTIADHRAAMQEAEQWRAQLTAAQTAIEACHHERLAMAEKEEATALEFVAIRRSEAEARASLAALMTQLDVERLTVAKNEEQWAVERANWRHLLFEARALLAATEATVISLSPGSSRRGLHSVWAPLARVRALKNRLGSRAPVPSLAQAESPPGGAHEVSLSDLHGASFVPKNHQTLLVLHELSRTGAPRVVLYLAQAIRQNTGVTPLIWSPVDGDIRAEFEASGFPVIVDPAINVHQPVHAPSRLAVASFTNVIVTSLASYRFVRHFGGDAKKLKWWIHEEVAGFEYVTGELAPDLSMLFEQCEALWLGSPLCFAPAGQHAPHHKLFMLLYGCEDTSKPAKQDQSGRMVISIVGSVEPRKGQDIFMDAIERLPREQLDAVQFRVIGAMPDWCPDFGASLHARAAAIPHIEFIPNVPPDKLGDLYASTDVVVSASRSDPMPLAITQGLMFGKACVCASVIGHAALLQDGSNALIFETENAAQLSEKLGWLILNPQAAKAIGENGRLVYEAHFLESKFVANVDYLLKIQGP